MKPMFEPHEIPRLILAVIIIIMLFAFTSRNI